MLKFTRPLVSVMSSPVQTQQLPNYEQMYQQDSTPLVNAATPGMEGFDPQPANGGGIGAFGSAFGGW